ncbi:MAG TPA: hypothetical protein VE291_12335 [Terracidiphilus sp.]|jgi:hypothetical protein|nr:hypothetical protein [Terracidiphilus sp.]
MRLCWKGWIWVLMAAVPLPGLAASCTTQADMQPQDRNALIAFGSRLAAAVVQQDYTTLQAGLLPTIASQWDGMHNEVEQGAAVLKGGQPQLEEIYLLDASSQTATADTQFFCSNQSGSLTVTLNMHALPPGRYAVLLAGAPGAALGGQVGMVAVWDATGAPPAWKLGGLSVRQGAIDGHDGVWYWTQARSAAAGGTPWTAWYSYDFAHYLLLPVDFLSSPNMEKLLREQSELKDPPGPFPMSIEDGPRTWKIESIRIDTSLREADLGVTYESLGLTDPAAARTEATAVLSAVVKAHPDLRQSFHGLWAYASHDGKVTPVIELPMAQIP